MQLGRNQEHADISLASITAILNAKRHVPFRNIVSRIMAPSFGICDMRLVSGHGPASQPQKKGRGFRLGPRLDGRSLFHQID